MIIYKNNEDDYILYNDDISLSLDEDEKEELISHLYNVSNNTSYTGMIRLRRLAHLEKSYFETSLIFIAVGDMKEIHVRSTDVSDQYGLKVKYDESTLIFKLSLQEVLDLASEAHYLD